MFTFQTFTHKVLSNSLSVQETSLGMLRHADCQIITDVSRDDNAFVFRVEQSTLLGLGLLAQEGLSSFELLVII
jgi:hypothetical protein